MQIQRLAKSIKVEDAVGQDSGESKKSGQVSENEDVQTESNSNSGGSEMEDVSMI